MSNSSSNSFSSYSPTSGYLTSLSGSPNSISSFLSSGSSEKHLSIYDEESSRNRSQSLGGFEFTARRSTDDQERFASLLDNCCKGIFDTFRAPSSNKNAKFFAKTPTDKANLLKDISKQMINLAICPLMQSYQHSTLQIDEVHSHFERSEKKKHVNPSLSTLDNETLSTNLDEIMSLFKQIQDLCFVDDTSSIELKDEYKFVHRKNWTEQDLKTLRDTSIKLISFVNQYTESFGISPLLLIKENSSSSFFSRLKKKTSSSNLHANQNPDHVTDSQALWDKIKGDAAQYLKTFLFVDLTGLALCIKKSKENVFHDLLPLSKKILNIKKEALTVEMILPIEFKLYEHYQEKLSEMAEDLSNPHRHEDWIQKLKKWINDRIGPKIPAENMQELLNKISQEIFHEYIQNKLWKKRVEKVQGLLQNWNNMDGIPNPHNSQDILIGHQNRFKKNKLGTGMGDEIKRAMHYTEFLLEDQNGPGAKNNNNSKKDASFISLLSPLASKNAEEYLFAMEKLISKYIFGDPQETLIEKLRHIAIPLIQERGKESAIPQSILDMHGCIFCNLAPYALNKIMNIKVLQEEEQKLSPIIKKIEEELNKTHSDVLCKYNAITILNQLFNFHRSFDQLFITGTMLVVSSVYDRIYPDDKVSDDQLTEISFGSKMRSTLNRDLYMKVTFQGIEKGFKLDWKYEKLMKEEFFRFEIVLNDEMPPASTKEVENKMAISFKSEIAADSAIPKEKIKEIEKRHERIHLVLDAMVLATD